MKLNQIPIGGSKLSAPYRSLADLFDLLAHNGFALNEDYGFTGGDRPVWYLSPSAAEKMQKDKHIFWLNVLYCPGLSWGYRKWNPPELGTGIDISLNI